jgi:hypothetical protein
LTAGTACAYLYGYSRALLNVACSVLHFAALFQLKALFASLALTSCIGAAGYLGLRNMGMVVSDTTKLPTVSEAWTILTRPHPSQQQQQQKQEQARAHQQ